MSRALVSSADVERVASDPKLMGEFARHYVGEYDPADALWWALHPGETAPSGHPSPFDELDALQSAVYGPPSPATSAAAEQLTDAFEAERMRARDAVIAVLASHRHDRGEPTSTYPTLAPPQDRSELTDEPRRRAHRGRIAIVGALCLLMGVFGGVVLGSWIGARPVDASGALAVFDRPQAPGDFPYVALDAPGLNALSFRSLVASPPVYVARGTERDVVCLVLVQPTGQTGSSCTRVDSFPASGLTIKGSYQNPGSSDPSDQSAGTFRQVDVTWLPDGTVAVAQQPGAEMFSTSG